MDKQIKENIQEGELRKILDKLEITEDWILDGIAEKAMDICAVKGSKRGYIKRVLLTSFELLGNEGRLKSE
jgi:hypothetical protein